MPKDFDTAETPSDRQSLSTLAILSMLMAFASVSTDLYLPALPAMAHALHANNGQVELTISGYLIGFSLGQLLWGANWRPSWSPLADCSGFGAIHHWLCGVRAFRQRQCDDRLACRASSGSLRQRSAGTRDGP